MQTIDRHNGASCQQQTSGRQSGRLSSTPRPLNVLFTLLELASHPAGEAALLMIRRREFIAGIGSAAAWPVTARGQQPDRARRVGMLVGLADDDR